MSERRGRRSAPAGDWQERADRATRALDNTRDITWLALRTRALEVSARPEAAAIEGLRALTSARSIGVLAGSFNPLTPAHVALADAARSAGQLDVIAWTLAVVTVDKEQVERATVPDRLAQLRAYCEHRADSAVLLVNRGLYVDQARAIRQLLAPDVRVSLVVGFDKIVQIFDPRYYTDRDAALAELFAEADLLVAPRAGQGPRELNELLARPENARCAAKVHPIRLAPRYAAESSSAVRSQAATAGAAVPRHLVAPEGWALVRLGAYAASTDATGAEAAYSTREAWERALPGLPASLSRSLPPLSTLAARAQGRDGADLREWLAVSHSRQQTLMRLLR
jgi:nicotinamide-nucleotide adenylyltransferase